MIIEISPGKRVKDATRRTALVVEDDQRLQKAMSKHLGRMNFRVLSANHYEGAVHHLAARDPHLVCVDVGLPSKSGYELCEHIRSSLGLVGLPILMTSEYGSPWEMACAEEAGGNAFLRKPFSMRQLTECVESILNATRWSVPPRHALQPLAGKAVSAVHVATRRGHPARHIAA